ncbi:hypothetical protein A6P08_09625 [Acidithiobacillus thiooxidans]|nr:hypothetical protein A6P08_09625 [Acidithiobacillus thiooxidans]
MTYWNAENLQKSIKSHFHDQAELVAERTANAVAFNINSHFDDLEFFAQTFFSRKTGQFLPNKKFLSVFTSFQRSHPTIIAINIQDSSGNRILWSSTKQSTNPITLGNQFSPLPGHPNRFLGEVRYSHRNQAWVLTMRQRILDKQGTVQGFIGSPFVLSALRIIHTLPNIQAIVVTNPHGQVVSVWKNGQWMPPNTPLSPSVGEVIVPVLDYPWEVHAQWTASALNHAFWSVERVRLAILLGFLFLIAGMGILTRRLLQRLLRLKHYQAAAVIAQHELLHQKEPQGMFQQLVEIIVEQTEAIAAYIVVPEVDSEWLRVVAASADTPDLLRAINALTPSRDPAHFPYGNMLPSLAFREKKPQGPVGPTQSPAMRAVQQQQASLSRIQSIMAYPVFLPNEQEPTAVLVINSHSHRHFTLPLQQLLGQLSGTLGLTLMQWRNKNELIEKNDELKKIARHDGLTGLPNRRFLENQMEKAIARAERHNRLLAVCMMDLDGFKPVNDTYGHQAGDEVLVALGKRLPEALRKSDFVARLGGDEFVMLLEDLEDLDALFQILKKIEETIAAPIPLSSGETVQIRASMGVAIYPFEDTDTEDQLLRLADQALYESKTHKADREHFWVLFGEEIHQSAPRTPAQHLLDAKALEVWYQPIMDSQTRRVVGVEALARLRDTEGTLWPPAKFLPQLQDVDFFDLSKKVLTQALADLPILDAQGCRLWASVNIDPVSISEDCITCLREMIAQGSVDPSRITLEILEGSNFLEQQAALEHLSEMKALGVHLALDDVGSAYSSLLRLKDLPIDEIKLDQGFIRTLGNRPQDLHFVAAIQDLAAGLGVNLVVEGVETEDILDAVTVMSVPLLQGYAIAKPMPLAELQTFLGRAPIHPSHPNSLLGLYAKQLVHHNVLKKAIHQDPRLVDYTTLLDAISCPVHADIQRLGADNVGLLDELHQEYHRAIAVLGAQMIASPATNDWTDVEHAQETLEQAIMGICCKRKQAQNRR